MARYFFDSSALVKRYHQESGSSEVEQLFDSTGNHFIVSRLALVEIQSSFARLVREGVIRNTSFDSLIARLHADVASGQLTVAAVSSHRLEEAAELLRTLGLKNYIRTLDAIHLATAKTLHDRTRIAEFIAADKRLLTVAQACGLATRDVG
jgi:predicted nucleic acid-binding protein